MSGGGADHLGGGGLRGGGGAGAGLALDHQRPISGGATTTVVHCRDCTFCHFQFNLLLCYKWNLVLSVIMLYMYVIKLGPLVQQPLYIYEYVSNFTKLKILCRFYVSTYVGIYFTIYFLQPSNTGN